MIVAVCGGIGTGKSAVTELFRKFGAFTLSADEINKELITDEKYLEKLAIIFPEAFPNGILDKRVIRKTIIADDNKRRDLNKLAHAEIIKEIRIRAEGKALVFVEVPLLTEAEAFYDKICLVSAREDIRVARIMMRDNVDEDEARGLIELQRAEEALVDKADFVIDNSGDLSELTAAVETVYKQCSIE